MLGERACVFVTLVTGQSQVTLEELCHHLLEQGIAKNKLPERLVVIW